MRNNLWLLYIPIIGLFLFFGKVGRDNDYLIGRFGATFILVQVHILSIGFPIAYLVLTLINSA